MKGRPADLVQAALQQHRAGQLPAALALYRQAAETDRREPLAPRLLALALAETRDFEAAEKWIAEALIRDPKSVETLAAQGHIFVQSGQMESGRTVLEKVLRGQPDFAPAHRLLVHIALAAGPSDAVIVQLQLAARALPRQAWPKAQLGRLLAGLKQFEAAAQHLAHAAALEPGDAALAYDLGVALQESGQTQAAIAAYQKALALAPGMVRARHNLASALQSQGDIEAALSSYAHAYILEPASFPRIAQDLAAGSAGQVWLRADALKAKLAG